MDADGKTIAVWRSLVRFCVLAAPLFLNGLALRGGAVFSWWMIVPGVAVFGFGPAILYLIVFNRRTRQSLHDLIVGSYVVRAGHESGAKPSIWKGHYVVLAIVLLIITLALVAAGRLLSSSDAVRESVAAYNGITQEQEVESAQVMTGNQYFWDNKGARTISAVTANVLMNQRIGDKTAEAVKIAHHPEERPSRNQ